MAQQLCAKMGVTANALDAILLSPSQEDLMRFKVIRFITVVA